MCAKILQVLHQGKIFKCPKRQAQAAASIEANLMQVQFQRRRIYLVPQKSWPKEREDVSIQCLKR